MTSTGYVALPFCLLVLWLPRAWCIPAVFVASTLADASIANPGNRSIPVGWSMALLVIGRVLWSIAIGQSSLRLDILRRLLPLAAFLLACVTSLLLALAFFQSAITVLPGSAGFNPLFARPYRLTPENLNQLVYLGLIFVFVYAVAHLAAELSSEQRSLFADRAMRWSCGFTAVIVAWDIAGRSRGIWFPSDFFHSDLSARAWHQGIVGVDRPSGPFPEPSALSYFYVMYLYYFWQRWRATSRVADELWFLLVAVIMVISTSTTSYLLLAAFVALASLDLVAGWFRGRRRDRGAPLVPIAIRATHLISVLVIVATVVGGLWLLEAHRDTVSAVIEETIIDKEDSYSYEVRANANRMAWDIFLESHGLGIGLGSHRPSSGMLSLLTGTGLLGTLAFFWLMAGVVRSPPAGGGAHDCKALRWAVLGLLMCHAVSGPEFQSIPLWASTALVMSMGLTTRERPTSEPIVPPAPALPQDVGSPRGATGTDGTLTRARGAAHGALTTPSRRVSSVSVRPLARIIHEAGRREARRGLSGRDRHRHASPYGEAGE